jgi:hypothetical protein
VGARAACPEVRHALVWERGQLARSLSRSTSRTELAIFVK